MAYDDDFEMDDDELSEEEKKKLNEEFEKEKRELKKHPLWLQANEIDDVMEALLSSCSEDDLNMYEGTLRESMILVKAKLYPALRANNYLISMQNASIIREHAQYLRLSSHAFNGMQGIDKKYVAIFRTEMEKFRELFKLWAKQIHELDKHEFEDEWGLFL